MNLYSGIGGNRKLWQDVEVTAVEINQEIAAIYQENFPQDTMIIGDAHEYLVNNFEAFDFIWSSPPCQTHSRMMKATRHPKKRYTDMSLYQEIILLEHFFKGKWVVENVTPFYDALIKPTATIGRHFIWSNFNIKNIETSNHENFIKADSPKEIESLKNWIGINYEGNIYYEDNHSPGQVLRNCVHPEIGLYIMEQALGIIREEKTQQLKLAI